MRRFFLLICLATLAGCATPPPQAVPLVKVNVLPLALSDAFEFTKSKLYLDAVFGVPTINEMIGFQQRRAEYGAIDNLDKSERWGNYFTFFWKAHRRANLTVRLEYRALKLGDYVQAQEIPYPNAKGTYETHFRVTGESYGDDGRVTCWRALLIEDGKIVALNQSLLWN